MSENYSVVLTGEVADGYTLEQVKTTIGKLFKLGDDKVSALFIGKPVVIRRGVDKQQAIKLQAAFSRAGAGVSVKKTQPASEPAPPPSEPSAAKVTRPTNLLNCPRCGHEQPVSDACTLCKTDLTLQLQRLERKEKMRIIRQQAN